MKWGFGCKAQGCVDEELREPPVCRWGVRKVGGVMRIRGLGSRMRAAHGLYQAGKSRAGCFCQGSGSVAQTIGWGIREAGPTSRHLSKGSVSILAPGKRSINLQINTVISPQGITQRRNSGAATVHRSLRGAHCSYVLVPGFAHVQRA